MGKVSTGPGICGDMREIAAVHKKIHWSVCNWQNKYFNGAVELISFLPPGGSGVQVALSTATINSTGIPRGWGARGIR